MTRLVHRFRLAQVRVVTRLAVVDADGSLWSWRSRGSILSLASEGSILSIGSVGSVLSTASVGSFASVGSLGSALSFGSALSWQSGGSLLSSQATGSVGSHQADLACFGSRADGPLPRWLVAGAVVGTVAATLAFRHSRATRSCNMATISG